MKPRALVSTCVVALLASVAFATSAAAPPPSGPAPALPKPGVAPNLNAKIPPVRIEGFRVASGAPYEKGPLGLLVDIVHTGDKPLPGKVRVMLWYFAADQSGTKMLETLVEVPPKSRITVPFTDPDGIAGACSARSYNVQLMGAADVESKMHVGWIKPTCTFKTKFVDSFSTLTPDRVQAAKEGRAFLSDANLFEPYVCGKDMVVSVKVHNSAAVPGHNLELVLDDVDGKTAAKTKIATLSPKSMAAVLLKDKPSGMAGKMKLHLTDPTGAFGKVAGQAFDLNVERSCTLSAKLDGPNPLF